MNRAIVTALLALLLFPCCRKPRMDSVTADMRDLVRDLEDTDCEVWSAAQKRLAGAGALATDPLLAALKSPNQRVQARVADVLTEIGKPAVLPLVEGLLDENKNAGWWAAEILGRIGDDRAVNALIETMESDNNLETAAAAALGRIGRAESLEPILRMVEKCEHFYLSNSETLARFGEPAVIPLLDLLQSESPAARLTAATALGMIGNDSAVEPIVELLEIEKHWRSRIVFIDALGLMRNTRAVEPLASVVGHADEISPVRIAVLRALGSIGGDRSIEILLQFLEDEDKWLLMSAELALKEITGQSFGSDHEKWRDWWRKSRGR